MNFRFKISLLFSFLSFAVLGQNIDTKHIFLDLQFNWEKKYDFQSTSFITYNKR